MLSLVVLLGSIAPKGKAVTVEAALESQAVTVQCYLPMVQGCAPQPIESPFSLQIAAEHQLAAPGANFLPDAGLSIQDLQAAVESQQARIDAAYPYLSQALVDSGAGWTRLYLKWSRIEPDAPVEGQLPVYRWDYYDQKYRIVADTRVRMIITVADSPAWAAPSPCAPIFADRYDEYAQFLTDLVNHYKQPPYNVKHWEIVNEPDYTWPNGWAGGLGCWGEDPTVTDRPQAYAQALAVAYPAIKAADPEATVLMGGIAHDWFTQVGGPFQRDFPDRLMASGGGNYMDTFTFHYFPDFKREWERWDPSHEDRQKGWLPAPTCGDVFDGIGDRYDAYGLDIIAKTTHLRNRMKTCYGVDKPIWVTELAEHGYANSPESLDQQARYVIQGHVRALAAGVINITWYALATVNDGYQQGLLFDQDEFGNWSPKPAFTSYRTLTSELKNYRYAGTRAFQNGELYVFTDTCGKEKLVAWNSVGGTIVMNGSQVRTIDYLGNVQIIDDGGAGDADGQANGSVAVLVRSPMFIELIQN